VAAWFFVRFVPAPPDKRIAADGLDSIKHTLTICGTISHGYYHRLRSRHSEPGSNAP
jgi:hypothetical protein